MSKLSDTKPSKPTDDTVTTAELNAVATGLGMLLGITSGAVVAAPDGGLQFSDTDQGQRLKHALCPPRADFLLP